MAEPQSARTRAFNTIELLEAILLYLDIIYVYRCREINRQWRHTIDHSINLQRALFLKPLNATSINDQRCLSSKPIINPSLIAIRAGEDEQAGLQHLDFWVDLLAIPYIPRQWQNMFFTQPHRSAARFYCWNCRENDARGWFGIQHEKGIRVSMVMDEIVKHVEACHLIQGEERESIRDGLKKTLLRFPGSFLLPPVKCVASNILDVKLKLESTPWEPTGKEWRLVSPYPP